MNGYELSDEVRAKYKPIIAEFLDKINAMTDEEFRHSQVSQANLNLSNTELNPYTLGELLEKEFGYADREQEDNGWQLDFWITYSKPSNEKTKKVTITGTGLTFRMSLGVDFNDLF